LRSAETLVLGRATYEGFAGFWASARGEVADLMNSISKVVFSRTLARAAWANTTLVKTDPAAAVAELKRKGKDDLLVFGSANLSATLIQAGLFDEYRLAIVPVLLGGGRRLFPEHMNPAKLELVESRALSSGGVILRYNTGAN
jgi:dihydrofolate reductase